MDIRDFKRAALFLCITLRLAALSSVAKAEDTDFLVGVFLASFTTAYTDLRIFIVALVRVLSCRSFFDACLVIGIIRNYIIEFLIVEDLYFLLPSNSLSTI